LTSNIANDLASACSFGGLKPAEAAGGGEVKLDTLKSSPDPQGSFFLSEWATITI
jgi:hypothetical protein